MRLNFPWFPWKAKESLLAEINSHLVNGCLSYCVLRWQTNRLCFINKLIYTERERGEKKRGEKKQEREILIPRKNILRLISEYFQWILGALGLLIFLHRFFQPNKIIHFHNISGGWINDCNRKTRSTTSCPFFPRKKEHTLHIPQPRYKNAP